MRQAVQILGTMKKSRNFNPIRAEPIKDQNLFEAFSTKETQFSPFRMNESGSPIHIGLGTKK